MILGLPEWLVALVVLLVVVALVVAVLGVLSEGEGALGLVVEALELLD